MKERGSLFHNMVEPLSGFKMRNLGFGHIGDLNVNQSKETGMHEVCMMREVINTTGMWKTMVIRQSLALKMLLIFGKLKNGIRIN